MSKLTLAARAEPGAPRGGCFLGGTGQGQAGRAAWLVGSGFTLLGVKSSCFLQHSGNLASARHRPHLSWGHDECSLLDISKIQAQDVSPEGAFVVG